MKTKRIASRVRRSARVRVSHGEAETEAIAARFARTLRGGEVVLLMGDLGAGKTVFVRGIARGLGVRGRITSPTFVLMRQYAVRRGRGTKQREGVVDASRRRRSSSVTRIVWLIHLDAYRIRDPRELLSIGLGEWFDRADAVIVIEWGDRVRPLLPSARVRRIRISAGRRSSTERRIVV